jgi:membrane dipeptidase
MNKLGIIIDISHASDQTALDAAQASKHPILISHAGAQSLWPSRRLKPDAVLLAVAEKGGLIGIEAAPHTTITREHREHTIDSVMEHFEYCVQLLGIDSVAFGPDTIYGDHVGLHREYAKQLAVSEVQGTLPEEERVPYVRGMENPSECFPNIVRWLVAHGYSNQDIAKVIGKNALRVMEKVWWN